MWILNLPSTRSQSAQRHRTYRAAIVAALATCGFYSVVKELRDVGRRCPRSVRPAGTRQCLEHLAPFTAPESFGPVPDHHLHELLEQLSAVALHPARDRVLVRTPCSQVARMYIESLVKELEKRAFQEHWIDVAWITAEPHHF
jgi:hypothetical protein